MITSYNKNDTTSTKKDNTLLFISMLQAIGCLFVVFGHSYPVNIKPPLVLDSLREFIYTFHMPLFILLSGYLFVYTNGLARKGYKKFIIDKVIKLIIPYIVLSLVAYIPKYLFSQFLNDKVEINISYLVRTFLVPRENIWGHFWFLPTLLNCFIVSPILLYAMKSRLGIFITSLLLVLVRIFPINTGWFALKDFSTLLLFFWAGCLVGKIHINKLVSYFKIGLGFVSLIISVILFFISVYGLINEIFNILMAILMIVFLISCSIWLTRNGQNILHWLNGKTFEIFLLSWPVQAVVDILLYKVLHFNWYIVLACMFILGILIPLLLVKLLKIIDYKKRLKPLYLIIGLK